MDPRVAKLQAAGFSDQDIAEYLKENPAPPSTASATDTGAEPPSVSMEVPPTNPADVPPETSGLEIAGSVANAVGPYVAPAAIGTLGAGGAYGLYKFGSKALDVGRDISGQMRESNRIASEREARLSNRPGFGGTPKTPVAPTGAPTAGPIAPETLPPEVGQVRPGVEGRPGTTRLPSGTMPAQGPVAPQAAPRPTIGGPAAAEGSNFIENISKKYAPAMGRAFGAAMDTPVGRAVGTGARVLGSAPALGAQLALTPSSTGPMVPSKGPLRGSEINPTTRRPWTAQEIASYEATVR